MKNSGKWGGGGGGKQGVLWEMCKWPIQKATLVWLLAQMFAGIRARTGRGYAG